VAALELDVVKLMVKHTAALLEGLVGLFGDRQTTQGGGEVGAKCNTRSTEGEQETSWHHKGHDRSIITRNFFIARGYTMGM
jgi:hypothetical protein